MTSGRMKNVYENKTVQNFVVQCKAQNRFAAAATIELLIQVFHTYTLHSISIVVYVSHLLIQTFRVFEINVMYGHKQT
jgi:hypothetical protein